MERPLQKNQEDGDHRMDIFSSQQDIYMPNLAYEHLRDDRHRFPDSINPTSSMSFQGDRELPSGIVENVTHQEHPVNQNSNGDIRLSMPAPKRTLLTSIVDSLNEDSLLFSGGQQSVFSGGFNSTYMNSDASILAAHSLSNLQTYGSAPPESDQDFDKRCARSSSFGEDIFVSTVTTPNMEFLYNRPSSTPLSASFASSSSNMLQYQQQQQPNHSNQNNLFHQRQQIDGGNVNKVQQQQDILYNRSAANLQQGYTPSHATPSNLQIHLADIDRRMEIRRGKSAGPCAGPYDGNSLAHSGDLNISANRQLQQQQLILSRSGTLNGPSSSRPLSHMDAMTMQQRPASTPLPVSLSSSHIHYMHQANYEHSKSHGPSLLNLCGLEDSSVEDIVAKSCRDILIDAASHSLKAVELANTLRARVGTEVLAHIRERWGGLLSLLERHTHVFRVERIPKNDLVTLVGGGTPAAGGLQSSHLAGARGGRHTSSPALMGQGQGQGLGQGQGQGHGQGQIQGQGLGHGQGQGQIQGQGLGQGQGQGQIQIQGGGDQINLGGPIYHNSSSQSPLPPNAVTRTLSPPISNSSMSSYHAHYSGAGEYLSASGGSCSGEGTVSRCLHVGNVPANMTETQLLRELERYGDVDCLKLVSQRSRRFAFVSFRTVEQAVSAKQRMTRVHPWKSAISFAHKESQSMNSPQLPSQTGSAGGSGSPAPYAFADQPHHHTHQHQQQQYFGSSPSPPHPPLSSSHNLQVNQSYQMQPQQHNQQQNLSTLTQQAQTVSQKQQEEEEELNHLFTRTLSVPPLAPSPYQRFDMDSVFGPGSSSTADMFSPTNSSFATDSGLGMIRPASTGSVNLEGNGNLYGSSLSLPSYSSFNPTASNLSAIGLDSGGGRVNRTRDGLAQHYGGFDYQGAGPDSSSNSNSSANLNIIGGLASMSMSRGVMSPQGPGQGQGQGFVRQVNLSHASGDDGNLGLDLDYDYDYDLLLAGGPAPSADRGQGQGQVQGLIQGQGQGHGFGQIQGQGPGLGQGQGQGLADRQLLGQGQGQGLGQGQGQGLMSMPLEHSQGSSSQAGSSSGNSASDFVLRRLCDDTYVPTQPWPVRWDADAFYCSAVIAQLQQFGGATTISKLRGFLRSRVNATDNIKSVPLKAMLSGYPGFFTVRSNQVTLAPDPLFTTPGGEGNSVSAGYPVGSVPGGGLGGAMDRSHARALCQSIHDYDIRPAPAQSLSPSSSPPSPGFGYGPQ